MAILMDSSMGLFNTDPFNFELQHLQTHDHPCFIYENIEEWQAFITTYINLGIEQNEKCLYIYDTHTARQVRDPLRESGLQLNQLESSGQLAIIHGSKIYLKGGTFEPEQMRAFLINATEKALTEGYTGLRVTGESEWVLQGLPGSAKLLEYESTLNRDVIPHFACLNVCQYDRSKFDPIVIRNLVLAHPMLIHHKRVHKNSYYIPTDLFLSKKRAEMESQFLIQNIEREDNRERELNDTVQKLQMIFKEATTVILVTDIAGHFIDGNQPALDFLEFTRDELLKSSVWDVILPEQIQGWHRSLNVFSPQQFEAEFLIKGNIKILLLNIFPITSENRKVFYSIGQDITQRKLTEKSLAESEEKIRQLYQTMSEGVAVHEIVYDNCDKAIDYIITDVNPAYESIIGMKKSEVIGRNASEVYASPHPPYLDIYEQVAASGQPALFESYFAPMQKYFNISVFSPRKGQFGTVFSDITSRKNLEVRNDLLAAVVQSSEDAILSYDLQGIVTSWNQAAEKIYGYSEKEILGKSVFLIVPKEKWSEVEQFLEAVTHGDQLEHYETVRQRKDGQTFHAALTISPIKDNLGQVTGASTIARDISPRKANEEALKRSEERLRLAQSAAKAGTWEWDLKSNKNIWSPEVWELYGMKPDGREPSFELWKESIFEEDRARVEQAVQEAARNGTELRIEWRVNHSGHEPRWLISRGQPLIQADGQFKRYLGIVIDITDRKQAEERIQLNESRLESLLRISQFKASGAQNLLDLALEEAIQLTRSKIGYIYHYHEERQEFVLNTYSKDVMQQCAIRSPETVYKLEHTGIWGEAVRQRKPLVINDYAADHPLKKGYPEGHAQLQKFMTIPVIVDEKVVAVVGVANKESDYDQSDVRQLTLLMDATWKIVEHNRVEDERKKNAKILEELYKKEREERLELEEEAKARGMFIDVLAHELRTPLTPIMISPGMLRDTLKPDSAEITQKLTRNIINSAEVLSHRLEELLEIAKYSRGTFKLNLHQVDVAGLINEIVTRFKPFLDQHDQQLTTRIAGDLPRAFLDPSRIEQVMINLLSNASKFSPDNGNISLTVRLLNNELLVEVQDNGIGISPDEQQRLFQPYHRVEQDRQKFPGIGLGLTVAKQIVEAHGGKIWLTSRPDEGSTFHLTLPLKPLAEQAKMSKK